MSSLVERIERQNLEANLRELRREKSQEAQKVNKDHKAAIEKQKAHHEEELRNIKNEQQAIRAQELKERAQKLEKIKESVEVVKETTNNEISHIKDNHQIKKENLTHKYQDEISDIQDRYVERVNDFKDDNDFKLDQIKQEQMDQVKQAEKERYLKNLKTSNQTEKYLAEIQGENSKEVAKVRHEKKLELKDEKSVRHNAITNEREQFAKDLEAIKKVHENRLFDEKLRQDKEFKAMQKRFEEKYTQKLSEQQKLSQTLTDKKTEMVQDLKKDVLESHEKNISLYEDDFYHYKKMDHKLTKNENGYLLEIPIDEKNRPYLSVRPYDKKVQMSFNRSFNEKRAEENSINKVSKIETFHKTISLDRPVNSKKVTSYFEDNLLKFNIPFA